MANSTSAVVPAASLPDPAEIERAVEFTREPFVYEGEEAAEALEPGSARRRALDAALAELAEGAREPVGGLAARVLAAAGARARCWPRTSRGWPTAPS